MLHSVASAAPGRPGNTKGAVASAVKRAAEDPDEDSETEAAAARAGLASPDSSDTPRRLSKKTDKMVGLLDTFLMRRPPQAAPVVMMAPPAAAADANLQTEMRAVQRIQKALEAMVGSEAAEDNYGL